MVYDKDIIALRNFTVTHPVGIKTREILKKSINDKFGNVKGVIGALILTDCLTKEKIKCMIDEILTECDILIVYYMFEHLALSEQLASVHVVEAYIRNERILVRQLAPYFNAQNYGNGHIFGNYVHDISIEKDLIEAVLIPNCVNIRFFYEKVNDIILEEYRSVGIEVKIL